MIGVGTAWGQGSLAAGAPAGVETRWSTPENPTGARGGGNTANRGAKGHAWDALEPGATLPMLSTAGAGQVDRIKITLNDRTPAMLRALRVKMFWDGATTAAVDVPFGDFFGTAWGRSPAFENAYFQNPEGRSYQAALPMPFQRGARIELVNTGAVRQPQVYWEVNWESHAKPSREPLLYLHARYNTGKPPSTDDFDILPAVHGSGRFLGAVVGIQASRAYTIAGRPADVATFWWGEGEVRIFVDDAGVGLTGPAAAEAHPTLAGTGGEDYFGTAWGLGKFQTMQAGCTEADPATLEWSCYRFHGPDPVWFRQGIRVAVQQIGGGPPAEVRAIKAAGADLKVVGVDGEHFFRLQDMHPEPRLDDKDFPDGWVLYRRSDTWSATAYFYLDRPGE